MPVVHHGRTVVVHLPTGHVLALTADTNGRSRVGRLADRIGDAVPDVPRTFDEVAPGAVVSKGPFLVPTRWYLEAIAGDIAFTADDGLPGAFKP